jgi:hypothetical protein
MQEKGRQVEQHPCTVLTYTSNMLLLIIVLNPAAAQPCSCRVEVMMDFHSHLDRHKVIGLLAGSWHTP